MTYINIAARKLAGQDRLPYGVMILFLCALSVFFSGPGQTYFTSVFIEHYISDFGWSRSMISSMYSLATLLSGTLLIFVGRLSDKYSSRKVTLAAAAGLGITAMLSSFLFAPWMLFLVFFLGRINGQGTLTLTPATILPRWYIRKRAFAFSLMSLGGVIGSALIPPLNNYLINLYGWRVTWRVWAIAVWVIFLPLVWLFLFDSPKQLNLLPDFKKQQNSGTEIKAESKYEKITSWTLREAMTTFSFWGMLFVQILIPMISTGITFNFVSIMQSKNILTSEAPFLLSIIALTGLPTALLAGTIMSRIKTHHAGAVFTLVLSLSMITLIFTNGFKAAVVFAVLQGVAQGIQVVWAGLVWPNYFGTRHIGSIKGMAMTATVIASAIGPVPFAMTFDLLNTYMPALYLSLSFAVVGLVISLFSPQPHKKKIYKNAFED